ncbi:GH3 auxin-responsive promoter family protein [uncultured Rubinisphaera sp.]|uniref:GH3 family domain-containing protein n=1 Tax=uncultured Rubinisphaera sp. TaxID=1678686 RepID=UPI0030D75BD6
MGSTLIDCRKDVDSRLAPWLIYPVTMTVCLCLFFVFERLAWPSFWASFAPALLGAGVVHLAERCLPARREWIPNRETVRVDVIYMIIVQILLPQGLALLTALTFQKWMISRSWTAEVWVHDWPILVQVALMILLADFLRYWLHMACHRVPLLWRFHAVHHSPSQLYWLNVGRFHPLEKATQFLFDALPFILLGVSERVLALYFVFYAVNGFFQHCNIELRFGWLNYLISSAELHRWHHSHVPAEANANYGNNVIVWDVLFGTRFLPENRSVTTLGLKNREYPTGFLSQLRSPFVPGLDQRAVEGRHSTFSSLLLRLRIAWIDFFIWRPIQKAADHPEHSQKQVLQKIMRSHRDTEFGVEHNFAQVNSLQDFQRHVPVCDYNTLAPYIERQEQTESLALNPDRPQLYNVTSGMTGAVKYIPIRRTTLRDMQRTQQLFTLLQHQANDRAFLGKIIAIAGAGIEGFRESGIPFGSASGVLYASMPRLIRNKYVLPPEVFDIADYDLKYYVILRLALAERNVTYFGTANPSTILRLLELLQEHRQRLLHDIAQGTITGQDGRILQLDPAIMVRCRKDPVRAEQLDCLLDVQDHELLSRFWPNLAMLSTWTGGSCGIPLNIVRKQLSSSVTVMPLGLMASELTVTVPLAADVESGQPTFWINILEFVDCEGLDEEPVYLGLHEVQAGRQYLLFVTTPSGLIRYAMNDIVEVTGYYRKTPLLKFIQKGAGVTNITGEKLHESQLIEAVHRFELLCQVESTFFLALADVEAACYRLFIEWAVTPAEEPSVQQAVEILDKFLQEANLEYAAKRKSGRLHPISFVSLHPGTGERYKQHELNRGRRESQFKILVLRYTRDVSFDFAACSYSES